MIRTLIIMTTYGQIFYSKETFFDQPPGESDISLTAGLISAVYNLTEETQQQKIEELDLEELRSIFRELPGEKLFIITVDKRMDEFDANQLLDTLAERFNEKYGDVVMDGLVLTDFEPVADEVVENKLWYSATPKKLTPPDYLTFLALLFSMAYYPYMLLRGESMIIAPLLEAFDAGFGDFLLRALLMLVQIALPLGLTLVLLIRYPNMRLPFRFAKEYIRRPTRGGYAELLPNWFLTYPVLMIVLFSSVVVSGLGMQYSLSIQPFIDRLIYLVPNESLPDDHIFYQTFWVQTARFLVFNILMIFLGIPALIGLIQGNLNWDWMKSSMIIIANAIVIFLPAHIISGIIYQTSVGLHPNNEALYEAEQLSLDVIFKVDLPATFFLFAFIFYIAIGMAPLVKGKAKSRFPIALSVSMFIVLIVQKLLFWFFFQSGWLSMPKFLN